MRSNGQGFEHQYGSYLASGGYFDRFRKRELDCFRGPTKGGRSRVPGLT